MIHVVRNEITLFGSIIYNIPDDSTKAMDYLRNDGFHIEPVISEFLPFKEYRRAFDMALSGNYGKVVMSFNE